MCLGVCAVYELVHGPAKGSDAHVCGTMEAVPVRMIGTVQ